MKALRPILPLTLPDVERSTPQTWKPELRWVAPTSLLVDEGYQRSLSDRSMKLIRRIVAGWDWASFKPPVCVEDGARLHVIDGQHTAIAAATHGGIPKIAVMVVKAEATQDRARAFVAHNRDRVVMTPLALHHAMVVAGDETALTIAQACLRAGVTMLRSPPPYAVYRPGETMAIGAVRSLAGRRHAAGARKVLEVCAAARLAPITADHIKAVESVMFTSGAPGPDQLAAALMSSTLLADAKREAARAGVPTWKALSDLLFRRARRAA